MLDLPECLTLGCTPAGRCFWWSRRWRRPHTAGQSEDLVLWSTDTGTELWTTSGPAGLPGGTTRRSEEFISSCQKWITTQRITEQHSPGSCCWYVEPVLPVLCYWLSLYQSPPLSPRRWLRWGGGAPRCRRNAGWVRWSVCNGPEPNLRDENGHQFALNQRKGVNKRCSGGSGVP